MIRILKWVVAFIAILVFLWVAAGCFFLFYIVPRTDVKSIVEQSINENINSKASLSSIDVTFFSSFPHISLTIDDLVICDSVTYDTIICADEIRLTLNVQELSNNKIAFNDIALIKPYVNLCIDSTGHNNISNLVKATPKVADTSAFTPVLDIDDAVIADGLFRYNNVTTGQKFTIRELNLDLKGGVDLQDSILDIRQGQIHIGKNSLNITGYAHKRDIEFNINHDHTNLNSIKDAVAQLSLNKQIEKADIQGHYMGECLIKGQLNDSLHGLSISGQIAAENMYWKTSKKKVIVKDGQFDIGYRYIIGVPDSSYIKVKQINLNGDYLSLDVQGLVTLKSNENPFIDAKVKANGNMAKLMAQTSLLPKDYDALQGNFKTDITISSSLYDLTHKYKYPKSLKELYDLNINVVLPNMYGSINIKDMNISNDTLKLSADSLGIALNGKKAQLSTGFKDFMMERNGKVENAAIKVQNGDISVDGKKLAASIKIKEASVIDASQKSDSIMVLAHLIDMNIACHGKDFADCLVEDFNLTRGQSVLRGARINGHLSKLSKVPGKMWDACSIEAYISTFKDNQLDLFCKRLTGGFNYNDKITDIKVNADSINVEVSENELEIRGASIVSEGDENYTLEARSANTEKIILGMPINVELLTANYNPKKDIILLQTGNVRVGASSLKATGNIALVGDSPKINAHLTGKNLDLNEIMIAANKAALASGDPNAVPLDAIPEGEIPLTVGADNQDITLSLEMQKMMLTSLSLSNVTGNIYMKGKTTLIDNLRASGDGYNLKMNTMVRYVNRTLSMNDIILDFDKLDVSKFGDIIPSLDDATGLLSSLKGTLDLKLVVSTPVRQILTINTQECKATAALQARDLYIKNNETLQKIAKELMFKNKEDMHIDSLAVAAEIENGQLKLYPFMLKIDRYKLAAVGETDMITQAGDFHISVLKSPIPFKFGIKVTGGPKYKVELVKTELKKLDPSVKPWTDPAFISKENSLKKVVEDFRSTIL